MRHLLHLGLLTVALLAIACIFLAESASAQEVSLSVSSGTGVMYGTAKEFVLDGSFAISELDWAIQPVIFLENTLDLKALRGLHASLKVRTGLPLQSGIITDSDWLNYPGDTNKTNFSQSTCVTDRAILLDAKVGWEFHLGDEFSFEPFAAFSYMSWQWTAMNGYLQYPAGWFSASPPSPPYEDWSPSEPKIPIYGAAIVFSQTYLIPAVGFRISYRLAEKWRLDFSFSASPLVYYFDQDDHNFAGEEFTESMANGWMIEPELSTEFEFGKRATFSAGVSFRDIGGLVGDENVTITGANYPGVPAPAPGSQYVFPSSAGAAYMALSVWLDFSLRL